MAIGGRSVDEYGAPLFIAWQLTNRCSARCIACCEESGPDKQWSDELSRDEAMDLARRIVDAGIPYAAFGGGEPLGVAHCWDLFDILAAGGVALKLETDGSRIDEAAADRIAGLAVQCVQISVDGAPVLRRNERRHRHAAATGTRRPCLVGVAQEVRLGATPADKIADLVRVPGFLVRLPCLRKRVAAQVGRRER